MNEPSADDAYSDSLANVVWGKYTTRKYARNYSKYHVDCNDNAMYADRRYWLLIETTPVIQAHCKTVNL